MNKSIWQRTALVAMGALAAISTPVVLSHRADAQFSSIMQQNPSPIGSWFGQALPVDPKTAPFPAVWMMPTMFSDGNVIASDSHELNSPHTTAHGNWSMTGPNSMHATFLWINFGPLGTPDGYGGGFRVSFDGVIDPRDPDHMRVTLHPLAFAPGQDALDPKTKPAVDGGIFIAKALTRIRHSKFQ